jgi:hypothetical protein
MQHGNMNVKLKRCLFTDPILYSVARPIHPSIQCVLGFPRWKAVRVETDTFPQFSAKVKSEEPYFTFLNGMRRDGFTMFLFLK